MTPNTDWSFQWRIRCDSPHSFRDSNRATGPANGRNWMNPGNPASGSWPGEVSASGFQHDPDPLFLNGTVHAVNCSGHDRMKSAAEVEEL